MRRFSRVVLASVGLALAAVLAIPTIATAATSDFVFVPGSPEQPAESFSFAGSNYVLAYGVSNEPTLYSFDGTTFVDVIPSLPTTFANAFDFTVFGSRVYFAGDDNSTTRLYSWDGLSASAPTLVTGSPANGVAELTLYDGALYFAGDSATEIDVLHRLVGSTVSEVPGNGSDPVPASIAFLTVYAGKLTMLGYDPSLSLSGVLFTFDAATGTFAAPSGTGTPTRPVCPTGMTVFGSVLAFDSCDGANTRLTTWDGTTFRYITAGDPPVNSYLTQGSAQSGGKLFFRGEGASDFFTYVFDGSTLSALLGSSTLPFVLGGFAAFQDDVIFPGINAASEFVFLRWSDGPGGGTVAELSGPEPSGRFIGVIGGSLYIVGDDGTNQGMWRYLPPPTPIIPAALPATGLSVVASVGGVLALGLLGAALLGAVTVRRPLSTDR